MKIEKQFFIISFLSHIIIFLLFFSLNLSDNKINKRFLVFGAYSKKPTMALFKSNKNVKTTDWFAQRKATEKQLLAKKVAFKEKKELAEKNKIKKQNLIKIKKESEKNSFTKNVKLAEKKPLTNKEKNIKNPKTKQDKLKIAQNAPPPLKNKNEITQEKIEDIKLTDTTEPLHTQLEELHFNLLGETNNELIKYQENIQKEVARLWKPPIGVPKGTECSIQFEINAKGNVDHFEITSKSNILIYDLSILQVAKNLKFDSSLWNKKFTIDFRQ